jgi:hypothetical protein
MMGAMRGGSFLTELTGLMRIFRDEFLGLGSVGALFGWGRGLSCPTFCEERPEDGAAGDEEEFEAEAGFCGGWVDFFDAREGKGDAEEEADGEVDS